MDSLSALDLLLHFRPGNVVSRLGRVALPVLSPRELLEALRGSTSVLPSFPIFRPELVPALLRAARFEEAVVGFTLPMPLQDRNGPERLAGLLAAASEETDHTQPIFLKTGPIPVEQADETTHAAIYRCVEAGFTLISLDASRLGPDAPGILAELTAPVRDHALALELTLPLAGPPPATGPLRRSLDALAAVHCLPQLLRFDPRVVSAGAELEGDWLQLLRQVTDSYGIALSTAESGDAPLQAAAGWARVGVDQLELSGAFLAGALGSGAEGQRDELVERSLAMGVPLAELLSLLADRLPPLSRAEALRYEARCFGEAQELLRAVRASGTGRRVVEMLAARER